MVEHVVREEKTIAAYELIDIYCELLAARLPIIDSQKNCLIDLKEAVTSVVFAAPRCADIPELQDVRKHFMTKYGKEFINAALEMRPDCGLSRMLVEKLSVNAPDGQTKIKILSKIAEEYDVDWDPKSFGEKESKPYDDLLKGPNIFDSASTRHLYPPVVQASPPYVHAQDCEEKPNAPIVNQQNSHSSNSDNFASSHFTGGQSTGSTTPYHPVEPSGTENVGTETGHAHSIGGNSFLLSGQNWTMEFKDATVAAQAAAESAERASVAARAAAQFAMNEHPHEENIIIYTSPSERIVKNSEENDNSPEDGNQENRYVQEPHCDANEKFYNNDQSSAKRYSETDSKSGTLSVSVDDKRPANNFDEVDRYSQKNSFKETVNPQSSGEDHNNFCGSSSSNDGDNYDLSRSHENFVFDDNNYLFDSGKSHGETVNNSDIDTAKAIFDSYLSDDDIIKFEKQPQYDELESGFYSASVTGKPLNHFAVNIDKGSSLENTSGLFKKPLSTSRISAELFSPPNDFEEELAETKSANKEERKEEYTKSKFSVPAGFFNPDGNDSEEDLPKKRNSKKVHANTGFSRRTKANDDPENNSYAKSKRGYVRPAKLVSVSENESDTFENMPKEKLMPSTMEQPATGSSLKQASHVHPKLPDIDSITAHLQSLRQNCG